jgi:hypothetical protein
VLQPLPTVETETDPSLGYDGSVLLPGGRLTEPKNR